MLQSCLAILRTLPGPCRATLLWGLPVAGGVVLYSRASDRQWCLAKADAAVGQAVVQLSDAGAASGGSGGIATIVSQLMGKNEFASGGVALMLLGGALASARVALGSAVRYCRRHMMVTAEIDSRDDAYRWVMHWLSRETNIGKHSTMVSVTTNFSCFGTAVQQQALLPGSAGPSDAAGGPPVAYLPAPGDHLMRYQGRLLLISRSAPAATLNWQPTPGLVPASLHSGDCSTAGLLLETLTISYFGTSRQPLDSLLRESSAAYSHSQASRTVVHSVDQDGYWATVGSRPLRPLSSVVLPQGQAEALLTDCQEFLSSEEWYSHHGVPYRRGYLLYGPPGTGKTSLVVALAGALMLEIYVVTLSSPSLSDEGLRNLLNSAGSRSILLLEDVDAAFVDRTAGAASGARLTFSGLLNAIDGVAAQEGRLLFMTTNHIERLSSALIRPGRVDVRCYLGPATLQQARDLFVSFYRDLPHLLLQPPGTAATGPAAAAAACGSFIQLAHDLPDDGAAGAAAAAKGQSLPAWGGSGEDMAQVTQATAAAPAADQTRGPPSAVAAAAAREQEQANREAVLQGLAEQFAAKLPADAGVSGVSMAQIQGHLMFHRHNPYAAVQNVQQLLQQQQQQ